MDTGMHTSSRDRLVRTRVPNIVERRWQTALINNYSPQAQWLSVNIHLDFVSVIFLNTKGNLNVRFYQEPLVQLIYANHLFYKFYITFVYRLQFSCCYLYNFVLNINCKYATCISYSSTIL